jgi:hypothetical protein
LFPVLPVRRHHKIDLKMKMAIMVSGIGADARLIAGGHDQR